MVRGNIRGRPNIRGARTSFKKVFVPRHPFDLTLSEVVFPKTSSTADDTPLTNVRVFVVFVVCRCRNR